MSMQILVFLFLPIMAMASAPLKQDTHFFANSARSDIPAKEGKFLAAILYSDDAVIQEYLKKGVVLSEEYRRRLKAIDGKPSCAAFFLENTAHEVIVGTASHCFDFSPAKKCEDGFMIESYATGHHGRCKSIVLEDVNSDLVLFVAKFDGHDNEYDLVDHLSPTMIYPDGTEEIEAYGYPADDDRRSRPTKSSNCHLFGLNVDPEYKQFYQHFLSEQSQKSSNATVSQEGEAFNARVSLYLKAETFLRHNCSIYGGNSGGPMVLKGTHSFIGMPESYNPTKQIFPADTYGILATPLYSYQNHQNVFAAHGIPFATVDHISKPSIPETRIRGRFGSTRVTLDPVH